MTDRNALKLALEELNGWEDTYKLIDQSARAAERKMVEAETELNALLKARAMLADHVRQHTRLVLELRAAEDKAKTELVE